MNYNSNVCPRRVDSFHRMILENLIKNEHYKNMDRNRFPSGMIKESLLISRFMRIYARRIEFGYRPNTVPNNGK